MASTQLEWAAQKSECCAESRHRTNCQRVLKARTGSAVHPRHVSIYTCCVPISINPGRRHGRASRTVLGAEMHSQGPNPKYITQRDRTSEQQHEELWHRKRDVGRLPQNSRHREAARLVAQCRWDGSST